ncbi:uncharacterized protein CXorf66-like [Chionomys nivalis]|uniref:uncharacterized protein CXorf66-like n=1 Tax=Chionomys nivalis TaxID=269649 RepID=UPI0025998780|nr:uncharacterized protein CXorf66-like [Chionomys nivalis]
MKVHIYFLFLSIWTISCLNINHINESSTARTTVVKTTVSTGAKMDDFRKRLLGFIFEIIIITFTFTCFCLLHYNCMIEEVQPPGGLNKENMEAISSWVSKVSACQLDIITEDILETQLLLLNSDPKAEPSCQENLSMPNDTIKPDEPSSLEKPCIPSNPQNSMRCTNTDKSSMKCSVKTSNRQFNTKRSTKSSNPQRLHKPSSLNKSYKKHSLKKSQKLAHTCKLSCSEMQAIPPWLTIVKTSEGDQTRHVEAMIKKDLAESKREHAGNPYASKTMKPFPKSFYEAEYKYTERAYKYKCYKDNESNETMKTCDSEDSDTEVVIICDRSHEDDDMAKSISTY